MVVINCADIEIQSAKCTQGDLSKYDTYHNCQHIIIYLHAVYVRMERERGREGGRERGGGSGLIQWFTPHISPSSLCLCIITTCV